MPKVKKGIREKAKEAAAKAKLEVIKSSKKKRKYTKRDVPTGTKPEVQPKWITDMWGEQGEVYFDGVRYWGTRTVKGDNSKSEEVRFVTWTPEQWEERKGITRTPEEPIPELVTTNEPVKIKAKRGRPRKVK